jgi:hypothetical protein
MAAGAGAAAFALGSHHLGKLAIGGIPLAVFETSIAKMRVLACRNSWAALMSVCWRHCFASSPELLMRGITDIARMLAGTWCS